MEWRRGYQDYLHKELEDTTHYLSIGFAKSNSKISLYYLRHDKWTVAGRQPKAPRSRRKTGFKNEYRLWSTDQVTKYISLLRAPSQTNIFTTPSQSDILFFYCSLLVIYHTSFRMRKAHSK